MLKRTLYFGNPYRLSFRMEQMVVQDKDTKEEQTVPIEDVAFVVFDHPQLTYTQSLMQALLSNNTALVICNDKHLPAGMLQPFEGNQLHARTLRYQLKATEPLKKQLWQQTIKAKISNQAAMLQLAGINNKQLKFFADNVKSGDSSNEEAKAAKAYWQLLFHDIHFKRHRYGSPPNDWLNYGYIVLRSAVARALVGSGLLPALGYHHRNQYNAYALADDVIEPYRPFVDKVVYEHYTAAGDENELYLDRDGKAKLLEVLTADTVIGGKKSPLMVAMERTAASLGQCYTGRRKTLLMPELPH